MEIKQLQRSYTVSIISHIFYKEQIWVSMIHLKAQGRIQLHREYLEYTQIMTRVVSNIKKKDQEFIIKRLGNTNLQIQ